jgi:hypothetical protein
VPGTGVKGAVRTAFELLSGGCPVTEKMERCRLGRLCPACALFGAMGHAGHVGFSEFVASADTSYEVTRAADGWPGKSQSDDYRVYDGRPATGLEGQPMPRRQAVEAMPVDTQLTGSCWFRSVPSEQLGRLLLAAGLGEGSRRVSLRLGGKKFDGFGEVRAKCLRVRLHEGPLKRRTLAGAEVAAWLRERVDAAVSETPGIDGVLEALKNG